MQRIRALIERYIFGHDIPFEGRLMNMVAILGVGAAVASLIVRVASGQHLVVILVLVAMTFSLVLLLISANKSKQYILGTRMILIVVCYIMFPLIFFFAGGGNGGVASYFAMCLILICLLMRGNGRVIFILLEFACIAVCYLVGYIDPDFIIALGETERVADILQSVVISGMFTGAVVVMLSRMYTREKANAERLGRVKSDFLANMNHELRTPMNAIVNMTALMRTSKDEDFLTDCIEKIDNAGAHLLTIINDMLDMAELEYDNFELVRENFNFREMIKNARAPLDYLIEDGRMRVVVVCDISVPRIVYGDAKRLGKVVNSLLSNSVKFTPNDGTGRINVMCKGEPTPDGKLMIYVEITDSGIGIDDENQKELFEAFYQADMSNTRRYGGTGLGLAITKNIVARMGGSLSLKSIGGIGSMFSFTVLLEYERISGVPASRAEDAAAVSEAPADETPEAADKPGIHSGKRALIVDDMEINREIAEALLEDTGLEIDHAENGREAVERFTACDKRYDVILMDIQMPVMDGYDATRQIRESGLPDSGTVIIIAMTANVSKSDVEKCLAAGMNDHIGKPIDKDELTGKLRTYLGER